MIPYIHDTWEFPAFKMYGKNPTKCTRWGTYIFSISILTINTKTCQNESYCTKDKGLFRNTITRKKEQ
jgi:hypothetical protein